MLPRKYLNKGYLYFTRFLGVDEQLSGNYAIFMHACYLIYTIDELSPRLFVSIFQHNIMIRQHRKQMKFERKVV